MAKVGRPTDYTEEVAARICEEIAEGKSIRQICRADDMPTARTVWRWLASNETFCQQYAMSREQQAELYAAEIIDIADEQPLGEKGYDPAGVNRNRLRVDARKWVASKLLPKKYGDLVRLTGADTGPIAFQLERIDE